MNDINFFEMFGRLHFQWGWIFLSEFIEQRTQRYLVFA